MRQLHVYIKQFMQTKSGIIKYFCRNFKKTSDLVLVFCPIELFRYKTSDSNTYFSNCIAIIKWLDWSMVVIHTLKKSASIKWNIDKIKDILRDFRRIYFPSWFGFAANPRQGLSLCLIHFPKYRNSLCNYLNYSRVAISVRFPTLMISGYVHCFPRKWE